MTIEKDTLKPCPFCGGEAESYVGNSGALVKCDDCGVETPLHRTEAHAIAAWNTRTSGEDR